ncbi:MAG: type II secretion system F family protein [Verrucomicrobiota bacterium]
MRGLAVVILAAAVAAAFATGAQPAGKAPVRLTPLTSVQFPDRAFILASTSRAPLSAAAIQVSEDGKSVRRLSITPASKTLDRTFGVVLAIDASNSMRGAAIENAMVAARAFEQSSASAQALGLVTFNGSVRLVARPTTDRSALAAALRTQPPLAEKTHLWDGVGRAVDLLRQAKITAGSVVVLTDGRDIGSRLSSAQVVSKARAAGVRVFAVGLKSPQFQPSALQAIARETNGGYSEAASPAGLRSIYSALSDQLAREYIVRYRSDVGIGRPVTVTVAVGGVPGASWRYVTPMPDSVAPFHRSLLDRFVSSPGSMALLALLAAALAWFAVTVVLKPRRSTVKARVGEFVGTGTTSGTDPASIKVRERLLGHVLLTAERALERAPWWERFKEELEIGQFPMRPVPLAVLTCAASIALAFFGLVSPVLVLLALVPPLIVRTAYKQKLAKRRAAFESQLPDNLTVLAASLRAGHSFVSGLSSVLDEAEEPSRSELRRAVSDEQLGVPVEDALMRVAQRMDSSDLEQIALVASLQREAGGNTAEVLDVVVESIRERFKLRRLVKALTAQGRLARWILIALPLVVAGWIGLVNPHYLGPLLHTAGGQALLVLAVVMVTTGSFVIKRITSIEL